MGLLSLLLCGRFLFGKEELVSVVLDDAVENRVVVVLLLHVEEEHAGMVESLEMEKICTIN